MSFLEQSANRGSVSTGFSIDYSCQFESSSSHRMYMTPDSTSSSADRKKGTLSFWIKRTKLDVNGQRIFNFGEREGYDSRLFLRFLSNDYLHFYPIVTWTTAKEFSDPAAWYHIVIFFDTTQAEQSSGSNHANGNNAQTGVWINGIRLDDDTGLPAANTAGRTQNSVSGWGRSIHKHGIGYDYHDSTGQGDFYLAEFHAVQGLAMGAENFGEFDEDSGIWKPKKYSGGHGTNGFYLKFDDSSDMGKDSSGESNDFTLSNMSASNQATDSPTNNFNVMTPLITYGYPTTLTHGNTKVTDNSSGFGGAASNFAMMDGKWYWEFKSSSSATFVGVQGTEAEVQTNNNAHEFPPTMGIYLGGPYNYAMDATSQRNDGSISLSFSSSDIYGVALDLDNNTIKYYQNNTQRGSTFSLDEVGTGAGYAHGQGGYMLRPWVATQGTVEMNFGGYTSMTISSAASDANGYGTFEYAPPSGYYALCTKNIAEYG